MSTVRRDIAGALPAPPTPGADTRWALFLDVDGTLLDFARNPECVTVGAHLHEDLAHVCTRLGGAVALLSGRPLSQIDALFAWHRNPAAGLHGAELRTPDGREHVMGDNEGFQRLRARANALAGAAEGVFVEDKHRALALHYCGVPGAREAAEHIGRLLLDDCGNGYTLQYGNHIVELKPAGADKGRALATLMEWVPFQGRRPWMLGDDLTDEDAFQRVNACDGVSVIVGDRRPTLAHYALASPHAVRQWLHALPPPPHVDAR